MNPNLFVLLIVALSLVPAVLIAVFAPHDALAKYAAIHDYVSICEALVPGIKRLARVSGFPEVTELVLSITWTLVPFHMLINCCRICSRHASAAIRYYAKRP